LWTPGLPLTKGIALLAWDRSSDRAQYANYVTTNDQKASSLDSIRSSYRKNKMDPALVGCQWRETYQYLCDSVVKPALLVDAIATTSKEFHLPPFEMRQLAERAESSTELHCANKAKKGGPALMLDTAMSLSAARQTTSAVFGQSCLDSQSPIRKIQRSVINSRYCAFSCSSILFVPQQAAGITTTGSIISSFQIGKDVVPPPLLLEE
jgi:hypothetical protein